MKHDFKLTNDATIDGKLIKKGTLIASMETDLEPGKVVRAIVNGLAKVDDGKDPEPVEDMRQQS